MGAPAFWLYDLIHTYASLLLAADAPITYVSAQLGHATPPTTLRYYARWIPSQARRWVEVLDRAAWAPTPKLEPESGTTPCKTRDAQGKWSIGEPSGTRPLDPLIKSEPREERKERDEYERSATYEDEDDDDHERRLKAR